jgi:hypothetical protein
MIRTDKLEVGDRLEFAKGTMAVQNRDEIDISLLQGTVESFEKKLDGWFVYVELDEVVPEDGNCVQFNLDEKSFGGASFEDLIRAKKLT